MDCTYTDFTQLYTTPFSLTSLFAVRQKWQNGVLFRRDSPRKSTGLIYLHRCNGQYTAADGTAFDAQPGSAVCLPAGSCYSVYNHDCAEEQDDAFLVEFNLHNAGKLLTFSDAPFLLDGSYVHRVAALLCEATNAFEAAVRSPVAVYAAVYTILSVLGKAAHGEENRRFRGILPAVRRLEQNDGGSVEELAAACGMSSGGFRRLFREYLGKSPVEYRTELRLARAQDMLENSDATLEYIAETLGYESAAYFCRVFKKNCHMTPTAYRIMRRA